MTTLLETLDRFLEAADRRRKLRASLPIERRLERGLRRVFRRQRRELLARLARIKGKLPKPRPPERIQEAPTPKWAWEREFQRARRATERELRRLLQEAHAAGLAAGAKAATGDLSAGISFSLKNPLAKKWLQEVGAMRVARIDDVTRDYLRTVITKGLDEGWSYNQIAKAITDRYSQFAVGSALEHIESRAHLIAVTEVGDAYVQGNLITARELAKQGVKLEKAWLTVGDNRVDEEQCGANEAEGYIPIDQVFPSGHDVPLAHPGCRCDVVFQPAGNR